MFTERLGMKRIIVLQEMCMVLQIPPKFLFTCARILYIKAIQAEK